MRDEQKDRDDLVSRQKVLLECNTEMNDSRNRTEEKAVAWRIAVKVREMQGSTENNVNVAKERYEDLCAYFDDKDTIKSILQNREEFKKWLERIRWHVIECDKLARELEAIKADEREWILCSERYPDEEEDEDGVLVTDGESYAVAYWRDDAKAWDSSEFGWIENREEPPCGLKTVIAWSPFHRFRKDDKNIQNSKETPMLPTDIHTTEPEYDEFPESYGKCPKCGGDVYDSQRYCDHCGQRIIWR